MTQEEIVEGNKLIAEFMGIDYDKTANISDGTSSYHENIKYNSSWSWLMPVIEKMEKIKPPFTPSITYESYTTWEFQLRIRVEQGIDTLFHEITGGAVENKLIKYFGTIVKFVQWYNTQSK